MMADTPLIRASRALARADSGEDCYEALDEGMQLKLQESVRETTLALRKPSDAMIRAALTVELPGGRWITELEATLVWERMVDAAVST